MKTDLEKAYAQLAMYQREPVGKSKLMDALVDAWNRMAIGATVCCALCGETPVEQGMDFCEPCFAKVEAYQDALVDRIKELR